MNNTINGRTPDEITYNCMMYRLKRPNEWDEHCAGSLTLKGRVETAKWAYNYIQRLERERDAAVEQLRKGGRACSTCKFSEDIPENDKICEECRLTGTKLLYSNWEWVGPQEVE